MDAPKTGGFKPAPFPTDFVDVSKHLPDVRESFKQASTVAIATAAFTPGPPRAKLFAGASAGGATLFAGALDYLRSDKASTVYRGIQQNNRALSEREHK